MFILMGFLVMGVKFEPTSIVDLRGKWTVGVKVSNILNVPSSYSISYRPWKTVRIEITGKVSFSDGSHYYYIEQGKSPRSKQWNISTGIGFYKYFRAHSSFSPFVGLVPGFNKNYPYGGSDEEDLYSISLIPGVEYFFGLFGNQWSLRFKTSLLSASRSYVKESSYAHSEPESYIQNKISFGLSSEGSLSTWLCFHF
ncbi:MAG: hypothetical protein HY769_00275 [Candidatus Stahlbacteria bacterium]|nr:hypothetical protein [Candidatus Stahlbacteria bacterium]